MEALGKLERLVLNWVKGVPHLPEAARKWLGDNIWWIVLVGAILGGLGVIFSFFGLITLVTILASPAVSYYAVASVTSWSIVTGTISLVFSVLLVILMATAIKPLRLKQKKGWVLLFATWLLSAVSAVVSAVLSLNPVGFIIGLIFGALWLAITGYFLFEIHGQFAHVQKSKGVKAEKASK